MRAAPRMAIALVLAAASACPREEPLSPERDAMQRACALDVRGTVALERVGEPASGTFTLEGAVTTQLTVTLTRAPVLSVEVPFLAQVDEAAHDDPIVFPNAENRFIGGGTTGNSHSTVKGVATRAALPGPGGSSATLDYTLELEFENTTDEVTGRLALTFREMRPNVVLEGETEHNEERSFALTARTAAPLDLERTAECQAAIDAYNESQDVDL